MPEWLSVLCRHVTSVDRLRCGATDGEVTGDVSPWSEGGRVTQVRTWDFTKAIAAAKKAEMARLIRRNRRNRTPLQTPLHTEALPEDAAQENDEIGSDEEKKELTAASESLRSCRWQHRHTRRRDFWNSFGRGDSTDDSEIIDAFG